MPMWPERDEDAAELTLLSFAASSALRPFERLRAMDVALTSQRLADTAAALRRQRSRLAAVLALRQAMSS